MIAPTYCFLPGELVRCNTGNQRESKQNPQSPWLRRVENSGRQSRLEFTWEGESCTGKHLKVSIYQSMGVRKLLEAKEKNAWKEHSHKPGILHVSVT